MRDLTYLNNKRVDIFGDGCSGDKFNGAFKINFQGTFYNVIASNGMGWEHVSVSHNQRIPSWEVMCKIKDMFFEDDEVVIQYHPKKSEYINNHPNCLHLWKPIIGSIPTPPSILAGIKHDQVF